MAWRSPSQLEVLLRNRGVAVIDFLTPTSEVAKITSSDDTIGAREFGEAISAAVGTSLGEHEMTAKYLPAAVFCSSSMHARVLA